MDCSVIIINLFDQIILELKNGNRPLLKISEAEIDDIIQSIKKNHQDKDLLEKFFCVTANTQSTSIKFRDQLLVLSENIKSIHDDELTIYYLSALNKQVIDLHEKISERYPEKYFEILKYFLKSKNPEVLEWTLRQIALMGPQGLLLKSDIILLRPNLFKLFNEHQRNSFEIVDHLLKMWSNYEK
jgi:hypothetical protein